MNTNAKLDSAKLLDLISKISYSEDPSVLVSKKTQTELWKLINVILPYSNFKAPDIKKMATAVDPSMGRLIAVLSNVGFTNGVLPIEMSYKISKIFKFYRKAYPNASFYSDFLKLEVKIVKPILVNSSVSVSEIKELSSGAILSNDTIEQENLVRSEPNILVRGFEQGIDSTFKLLWKIFC